MARAIPGPHRRVRFRFIGSRQPRGVPDLHSLQGQLCAGTMVSKPTEDMAGTAARNIGQLEDPLQQDGAQPHVDNAGDKGVDWTNRLARALA